MPTYIHAHSLLGICTNTHRCVTYRNGLHAAQEPGRLHCTWAWTQVSSIRWPNRVGSRSSIGIRGTWVNWPWPSGPGGGGPDDRMVRACTARLLFNGQAIQSWSCRACVRPALAHFLKDIALYYCIPLIKHICVKNVV